MKLVKPKPHKQPHDIATLPRWAQAHITQLAIDVTRLRSAHAVLSACPNWLTIGPVTGDIILFEQATNGMNTPRAVCLLSDGDVLVVGRK